MSSTLSFGHLQDRVASFKDCKYSFKNRDQAVLGLSVAGFHFKNCTASLGPAKIECHICNKVVDNTEDMSFDYLALVCSFHNKACLYYQAHDAPSAASQNEDVRVVQSNKYKYVESPSILVQVGVQPDAQDFTVHEDLVCLRSDFFRNALKGGWKESEERKIPLPDDEPEVFSTYLQFLYSDTLPVKDATTSTSDTVSDEYTLLGKLFVLSEKLMDEKSKTTFLAALTARAKETAKHDDQLYYPAIETVQIIYEGTQEGSLARGLMVDLYTEHVSSSFVSDKSDTLPKDFLRDLSVSLLTKRPLKKEMETLKRERDELHDSVHRRHKRGRVL